MVPVSSAEAERGFSQTNLVCTKSCSGLSVAHLSSLMFILINGLPVQFWEANDGWNATRLPTVIKIEK